MRILKVYLSLDRKLVGGDEIAWPSNFPIHHDDGITVVIASFLAVIIIATWQVVGARDRDRSRSMLELLSCR
jgi:hypothetical protein